MKTFLQMLAAFIVVMLVFLFDKAVIAWAISLLPASVNDWKPFIKVVFWILALSWTLGITIVVVVIVGGIVGVLLGEKRK